MNFFFKVVQLIFKYAEKIKYELYENKGVSNYCGRGNVALKQSENQSFDFREIFVVNSSNFDEYTANFSASLIFKFYIFNSSTDLQPKVKNDKKSYQNFLNYHS